MMSAPVFGLDKQLGSAARLHLVFATRVRTVDDQLIARGCADAAEVEEEPPPNYVSYIDPVSGTNLGNLNSESFYVMRGELKTELEALPRSGSDSRYANVHLVNDDAVTALLKIAGREKE